MNAVNHDVLDLDYLKPVLINATMPLFKVFKHIINVEGVLNFV